MPALLYKQPIATTGIELFRAGLQTDSNGASKEWSIADLDEMVESYNAIASTEEHEAPIQVGHDSEAAYAWLERVYREGDVLKGDYKEVDEDFAEALNKGRYKKRSISIYPRDHAANPTPGRLNLRHVAYVGVPAVKGLKNHKFAENDDAAIALNYDFEEDAIESESKEEDATAIALNEMRSAINQLSQQLQEFADMKKKSKPMDEDMEMELDGDEEEEEDEEEMEMTDRKKKEEKYTDMSEQEQEQEQEKIQSADFEELKAQLAEMKAANERLASENKANTDRLASMATIAEAKRVRDFVERLTANDKRLVLPQEVNSIVELALTIPNDTTSDYSEGDGKVARSPRDQYLHSLTLAEPKWGNSKMRTSPSDDPNDFSEEVRGRNANFDRESNKTDMKIRNYMRENSCDYAEATRQLISIGQLD